MKKVEYVIGVDYDAQPIYATHYVDGYTSDCIDIIDESDKNIISINQ